MGLFDRGGEPVFLKEPRNADGEIATLQALRPQLNGDGQRAIDEEIRRTEFGARGEHDVAYELRTSHLPIFVIPDWQIEHGGLTAQIDFLVLAPKLFYVIESKRLYGDVEVTADGEFRRRYNGRLEGMYSPFTQNQKHLDLIKAKVAESRSGFQRIATVLYGGMDKVFEDIWKPLVVLANDKTVLKAPAGYRNRVKRADQLVDFIRRSEAESKETKLPSKDLRRRAEKYLSWDVDGRPEYLAKFDRYRLDPSSAPARSVGRHAATSFTAPQPTITPVLDRGSVLDRLRAWRDAAASANALPAESVFADETLQRIASERPQTVTDLRFIKGVGEARAARYGHSVLEILARS